MLAPPPFRAWGKADDILPISNAFFLVQAAAAAFWQCAGRDYVSSAAKDTNGFFRPVTRVF